MNPIRTSALCACVVLGAPAAAASAAGTVTLDRACYSPGEAIMQTGAGFTPNSQVVESLNLLAPDAAEVLVALFSSPVPTDANGAFARGMPAPPLARETDRQEIALSAFTDQGSPDVPTFAQWTLSSWDFALSRDRGRISTRTRLRVDTWGWTSAGERLYVHYQRGAKHARTAAVGALAPPCGDLVAIVRLFPSRAKPGKWRVAFSATPTLDRVNDAWFGYKVTLPRSRAARRTSSVGLTLERHPVIRRAEARRYRGA